MAAPKIRPVEVGDRTRYVPFTVHRPDDPDAARAGESYPVEWVTVDEPNPAVESGGQSTRAQAQAKGAALFNRTEGAWARYEIPIKLGRSGTR